MTILTDDSFGHEGGRAQNAVERALAAAIRQAGRLGELLDELSRARLWLPLPADRRPVTDGSAVHLPTVKYRGTEFVPAFTSAARLHGRIPRPRLPMPATPGRGIFALAPVRPHIVVPAAALAQLLPAGLGIALNPSADESVAIYPEGVSHLAAAPDPGPHGRVSVGPPPVGPDDLLARIGAGMAGVPGGEGEADRVDEWIASSGTPFYRRAELPPGPAAPPRPRGGIL